VFYQIEFPTTTGFLDLALVIPAFMQQQTYIFIPLHPRRRVVEQHIQLGKGSCRDHIAVRNDLWRFFDADGMNRSAGLTFPKANPQKRRLFLIAFDQIDVTVRLLREENRGNDAGKTATATEVDPMRRFRVKLKNLRAVRNMTSPEIIDS